MRLGVCVREPGSDDERRHCFGLLDLIIPGTLELQPHELHQWSLGASEIIKQKPSPRSVFSIFGKTAIFAIAASATALAISDAEAQTAGMERRQGGVLDGTSDGSSGERGAQNDGSSGVQAHLPIQAQLPAPPSNSLAHRRH
jgi:hypothetical protein